MRLTTIKFLLMLLSIALLGSGCGLITIERVNPTLIIPTQKPIIIVNTPIPNPSNPTPAPTLTIAPPALPPVGSTRLAFAQGATSGIELGYLPAHQVQNFIVRALQGQPMLVNVDSNNHDVTLSITGLQGGQIFLPASSKISSWQGLLPSSQDYLIQIIGGENPDNFYLTVNIPSRIKFNQGSTSTTVSGYTPGGLDVTYVLNAMAGQTITVSLNVAKDSAALTIYGYSDGQPMVRAQMNQTTFSAKLPSTQDYIIEVVPFAGTVVNYSMKITVK